VLTRAVTVTSWSGTAMGGGVALRAFSASSSKWSDGAVQVAGEEFKATHRHIVEMFLDEFVREKDDMHKGRGWYCMPPKGEQQLYHWRDQAQFTKNSVIRLEMIPLGPRLKRFVEIHFNHRFMLIHQHDTTAPDALPEEKRKRLQTARATLNEKFLPDRSTLEETEQMVHFNDVGVDRSLTTYTGVDIPSNWLLAMKSLRWPASYNPDYLDKVEYFEFFRHSPLLDKIRERHTHGDDANYPYWWDLFATMVVPEQRLDHPSAPEPPQPPGHINLEELRSRYG